MAQARREFLISTSAVSAAIPLAVDGVTPQPPSPAPASSLSSSSAAATSDHSFKELAIPARSATTFVEDRIAATDCGSVIVGNGQVAIDQSCCNAHVDRQLFNACRGTARFAADESITPRDEMATAMNACDTFSFTSLSEAV